MESDREYPCKDYKKKARKRNEKRTEMHGTEQSTGRSAVCLAISLYRSGDCSGGDRGDGGDRAGGGDVLKEG